MAWFEEGSFPHTPLNLSLLSWFMVSLLLLVLLSQPLPTHSFLWGQSSLKYHSTVPYLQFRISKSLKVKTWVWGFFGFSWVWCRISSGNKTGRTDEKLFYLHTHLVWSSIYFTAEIAMWPIIRCCPQPHGACSAYLVTFWILKHLWLQGLQIRSVGTGASLTGEVPWPFLTIWRVRRQPSGSVRVTGKPRIATLPIRRQNPCLETAGAFTWWWLLHPDLINQGLLRTPLHHPLSLHILVLPQFVLKLHPHLDTKFHWR